MHLLVLYKGCGQKADTYWHQLYAKTHCTQCTANGRINVALLADFVHKETNTIKCNYIISLQ